MEMVKFGRGRLFGKLTSRAKEILEPTSITVSSYLSPGLAVAIGLKPINYGKRPSNGIAVASSSPLAFRTGEMIPYSANLQQSDEEWREFKKWKEQKENCETKQAVSKQPRVVDFED